MFGRLLAHKVTFVIAGIALAGVVLVGGWYVFTPQARHYDVAVAGERTIEQTVTASGAVDSDQHVSLSFRASGTVAAVHVNVGDTVHTGEVLASLDNSTLEAQLQGAKADILSAQAGLSAAQKGATSETRTVSSQSVSTAATVLGTAENDAYTKVVDAILNKVDQLYTNGNSQSPTLLIPTPDYASYLNANNSRVDVGTRLNSWKSLASSDPTSGKLVIEVANDIAVVKSFLAALGTYTNRLSESNTGLSQTQISGYVTTVNGAASEVNDAAGEFSSALQAWQSAKDQQAVVVASSTSETIQSAQAGVAKATAAESALESQISNGLIVAPFNGVVGSVSPKVSETVTSGTPQIDILSNGTYKIDIMIPQNQVGLVAVGNPATITFDAYGSSLVATGTVSSIDLSETVNNGVAAYKTVVRLSGSDPRIRTGMTANVSIGNAESVQALTVPTSAVITNGTSSFVLKRQTDGSFKTTPVIIGTSDGTWTSILSGLASGDVVAVYGNQ